MHVQVPLSGGGRAISAASGRRRGDASPSRLLFQDRSGSSRADVSNDGIRECNAGGGLSLSIGIRICRHKHDD